MQYTLPLSSIQLSDISIVGGKNASLGEMISHLSTAGIDVPTGFATTADAFVKFLEDNQLTQWIHALLAKTDVDNIEQLTTNGQLIRDKIIAAHFSADFIAAITDAYQTMVQSIGHEVFSVAVRSSATAEDLPNASFAGQQETYLNIQGIDAILIAIKAVFASLYNDRAIAYRVHHGFLHQHVSISAGIQYMVRSDIGSSGVMFTLDTESGFEQVIFITSAYGLGEMVVQGAVNPDEFYVYKPALKANKQSILRRRLGDKAQKMIFSSNKTAVSPIETVSVDEMTRQHFSLTDDDVIALAKMGLTIEAHYGRPMDIEWAKDGITGRLMILQARPETVNNQVKGLSLSRYTLKNRGKLLTEGRSIGQKIGIGRARIIHSPSEMSSVQPGDVLISDMTDPDWEPVMKKSSAIVTNRGGRTCHAAIIARELGIPAVVGCGDATKTIQDGEMVTVSCSEGDTGYVYEGELPYDTYVLDIDTLPSLPVKIMLNVGHPDSAFQFSSIPNAGVGLARLEFIISNTIGIHPNALLQFDSLDDDVVKNKIKAMTKAYASPIDFYIEKLKEGISTIGAAFYPNPVILRLSDFKSNEYANLVGGQLFEPHEENPMIGFRGASRYVSKGFKDAFALECKAVKAVREEMGLMNIEVMIPFVRTVEEAKAVIDILADNGLKRGENGLRIIMMCEVPSNALLAADFLPYFDGFSIGSNDLTQLTLGLDRDSGLIASQFDERNDAVKQLLVMAIDACLKAGKYIGICGQGPSDHPDFAAFLIEAGIETISLNPDSVVDTTIFLSQLKRGQ